MPASRREFLYGLGAAGALAMYPMIGSEPDLILYNGQFWTVDALLPKAQAIAISGGRFFAVGSNDEIIALAAGRAKKIDLGGKTVLPGFIDAHSHPAQAGLSHLRMVDCDLRSVAEILKALRERAAKTPPGEWVLGFKYDDTKTSEGRPLTRKELDVAVPDRPVFVEHRGGHTAWVNTPAIKLAGSKYGSTPMSINRGIAPGASLVWSVEKTRWPVSAARTMSWAVSVSRVSPTRMMSGS